MLGRIIYLRGEGPTGLEREEIGGLALVRARICEPEGLRPWRLRRRLRELRRQLARRGVRRLVLPEGFPYAEAFAGFGHVEALPLYRATADLLAMAALHREGTERRRAVVALSASRLCPELRSAAERLCPQVRGLAIDVPGDGARYSQWLHEQYGLPVSPAVRADVTVAFSPGGGCWGQVLELYGAQPDLAGLTLSAPALDLPEECAGQLLAALWEQGILAREDLVVGTQAAGVFHAKVKTAGL